MLFCSRPETGPKKMTPKDQKHSPNDAKYDAESAKFGANLCRTKFVPKFEETKKMASLIGGPGIYLGSFSVYLARFADQ